MLLQQRCPPKFLRGPFRAIDVARPEDAPAQVRAWTLWLLLPRLLLQAPTASQSQSGARGFWTSRPAGGSCSFRVPPVASQPLRVTPNRRFRLPSEAAARRGKLFAAQPSSPAPWPLCRRTPLPSCATQPGDPPSRTSPCFLSSSLRPLSRSPPTRSCAVPVKEQEACQPPLHTCRRRSSRTGRHGGRS